MHRTPVPIMRRHSLDILVINDGKNVRAVQYGEMWRMQLVLLGLGLHGIREKHAHPQHHFRLH